MILLLLSRAAITVGAASLSIFFLKAVQGLTAGTDSTVSQAHGKDLDRVKTMAK